jgi:hypothetical protein
MSQQFFPSQTHVLPLTAIRRQRVLPWQGEVLIGTGQSVEPSDVVARAGKPRPYLILDVSQRLGVAPERASECYLKRPGELVRQGEPLAMRKGLIGGRKIVSPVEGMVMATEAGRMIIQPRPEMFELRALLSGMVTSIALGGAEPGGVLRGDQIEVAHHGSILVCGSTLDMELLDKAQEVQARGLIVGGVPAELREQIMGHLVPVIATEGMGRIPISSVIFNLLRANEGREAMMLAVTPDRWRPDRPEIIIPLPAATAPGPPPAPGVALSPGVKVRIRRAPYWGQVGTVKTVHIQPQSADGGVKYPGADVALDDGTVVFIPHVNLDLVG